MPGIRRLLRRSNCGSKGGESKDARYAVRRHPIKPALEFGKVLLVHQVLDEVVSRHVLTMHQVFYPTLTSQQFLDDSQMPRFFSGSFQCTGVHGCHYIFLRSRQFAKPERLVR